MSNDNQLINSSRINSLINSMSEAVIAVDKDLNVELYNSSALNLLDMNSIGLKTKLTEIFHPINNKKQFVDLINIFKHVSTLKIYQDLLLNYNDGSVINLYMSITPVHESYGKDSSQGYVIILKDITKEKSLEEERDEFVSVVSHELRTPIAIAEGSISNAIITANNMLDMKIVSESLDQAHKQVLYLADLVNDLSTLSRAERGILKSNLEKINVSKLLREILQNYSSQVRQKGLKIKIKIITKDKSLMNNPLYLKEILQNFVTNAIKYSHKGTILITAEKSDIGIKFSVKDNGIGISKSDQKKVFDKFFRSEDFRTRQASGTGLGLYVTAKLATLIKAKIELHSKLNSGSTFIIDVPDLLA